MSYRLQTLDIGIAMEQLCFVARQLGFDSSLHLEFLDSPLHHLLGLDPQQECIYAAIPLYLHAPFAIEGKEQRVKSQDQCASIRENAVQRLQLLAPVTHTHIQPFTPHERSQLLDKLYAASLLKTLPALVNEEEAQGEGEESETQRCPEPVITLPAAAFPKDRDLAQVLLRRRTHFNAIDTRELQLIDVATLLASLKSLDASCTRIVEGNIWQDCRCEVYCAVGRVQGVASGIYRYNIEQHTLSLVHMPVLFPLLMRLVTAPNIHPHTAPLNLFFSGDVLRARTLFGERGMRIMGIEVGRAIQHITLAATAKKLATHTHLSYLLEATRTRLLRSPSPSQMPLASMIVGHAKQSQGGLLELLSY